MERVVGEQPSSCCCRDVRVFRAVLGTLNLTHNAHVSDHKIQRGAKRPSFAVVLKHRILVYLPRLLRHGTPTLFSRPVHASGLALGTPGTLGIDSWARLVWASRRRRAILETSVLTAGLI